MKQSRSSRSASEVSLKTEDKYSEAWYELGAPIWIPFVKYILAVAQYALDNFFFIKNTINAFQYAATEEDGESRTETWMAACTLGLHIASCILISFIDAYNKDAISGQKGRHLDTRKHKCNTCFRLLAHITLTMKLLRYTTGYLENRKANKKLHEYRQRRVPISEEEIQYVVLLNKNQLVESHYDLVESFIKTVPAALLQVFFMFQTNPDARLRLYSTVDQDRFATVFFTIITASIAAVNYQSNYMSYQKTLHFQDSFRSLFKHEINLNIPGDFCFVTSIIMQIGTTGIRVCFYSMLLFWSPKQFLITIIILLCVNWLIICKWGKTSWRFRAVLENPLYGVQWFCFDLIDLWINLFVPGVHYPKTMDHFLNFYTTTLIGVVIFKGYEFMFPVGTNESPTFDVSSLANISGSHGLERFNLTVNQRLKTSEVDSDTETVEDVNNLAYTIVKYLLIGHDYLTLNQMTYAEFFQYSVKFMNIVNLICILYTCVMNMLKLYDLDFPLQVTDKFFKIIFQCLSNESGPQGSVVQKRKAETFLVFCMLHNAQFFSQVRGFKKFSWRKVDEESLKSLAKSVIQKNEDNSSGTDKESVSFCTRVLNLLTKAYNMISPIVYPARFRVPNFSWEDVPVEIEEIKNSIKTLPLESEIRDFIDIIHEKGSLDVKILLGAFCSNYNEIVRHFTSLRINKTLELIEVSLKKRSELDFIDGEGMSSSGAGTELTHLTTEALILPVARNPVWKTFVFDNEDDVEFRYNRMGINAFSGNNARGIRSRHLYEKGHLQRLINEVQEHFNNRNNN